MALCFCLLRINSWYGSTVNVWNQENSQFQILPNWQVPNAIFIFKLNSDGLNGSLIKNGSDNPYLESVFHITSQKKLKQICFLSKQETVFVFIIFCHFLFLFQPRWYWKLNWERWLTQNESAKNSSTSYYLKFSKIRVNEGHPPPEVRGGNPLEVSWNETR